MLKFVYDKTAKLYQRGLSRDDAEKHGADMLKFDSLELEFKGGSIPMHLILGIPYKEPYSCDYHTGGKKVQLLRELIKKHNTERKGN